MILHFAPVKNAILSGKANNCFYLTVVLVYKTEIFCYVKFGFTTAYTSLKNTYDFLFIIYYLLFIRADRHTK